MTNTYAYQGAQDQGSDATEFNSTDFHIRQVLATSVRTAVPVKVIRAPYDENGTAIPRGSAVPTGYVDVQPLVNQLDGRGQPTQHGVVYKLSYYRYQGGNFAIISDPVVGDVGKMVIADRDTSVVRKTRGQISNPGSTRKFDPADGTYFGTMLAGAPQSYVSYDGSVLHIVVPAGQQVLVTGDLKVTGKILTNTDVDLAVHVHTDPQGGDVGAPKNP